MSACDNQIADVPCRGVPSAVRREGGTYTELARLFVDPSSRSYRPGSGAR